MKGFAENQRRNKNGNRYWSLNRNVQKCLVIKDKRLLEVKDDGVHKLFNTRNTSEIKKAYEIINEIIKKRDHKYDLLQD